MHLGKPSIGWLSKTVEELIRGDEIRSFYKTFRMGNLVHIANHRVNSDGRFLEVSEYGAGGRRSFIIIPEGREWNGWLGCGDQLRKVSNYFEKVDVTGSKLCKNQEEALRAVQTGQL